MIGETNLDRMRRNRGPRYLIHGTIRRGEFAAQYAPTLAAAETIAATMREQQYRAVRIVDPVDGDTTAGLADAVRGMADARAIEADARSVLAGAVARAVEAGMSEYEAARQAGVDRMTVRAWLGKR